MNQNFHYGNQAGFKRGLSVSMDTRDFEKRLDKFMTKDTLVALRRGLGLAFLQLLDDIVLEAPMAPVLTSALVGSITVFVNNKLVGDSDKYQTGGIDYQSRTNTEPQPRDAEQATLVVNAPYATVQHENFPHKSKEGAGMFFVIKKVIANKTKYGQIVVNEIRKVRT